jgi:pyrroline-5-carboxylate reductase
MPAAPILIAGAGRMGGAIISGWMRAGAFSPRDLMIRDPFPGEAAMAAIEAGATLNPDSVDLSRASTVLFAFKPQSWRDAATAFAGDVAPHAIVISVLAGIGSNDVAEMFPGRPVARVMPTTAASICRSTTSVFAETAAARGRAHTLFEPLGAVVDLPDEALMHAATAASGSAPAYLYAFIEALRSAATDVGLPPAAAARLARSTITGAAALLDATGEDPAELRRQVTSPGGTTEAALQVLMGTDALPSLLRRAVAAAVARSKELAG